MSRFPKKFFLGVVIICWCSVGLSLTIPAAANGELFSWTKLLSEPAIGVDWSPDGQSIVFGAPDSSQVGLLNWQTGETIWRTPFPKPDNIYSPWAYSARWSRDGKWIAVTNGGKVYLADPQTGHFKVLKTSVSAERTEPDYMLARWGNDSNSLAVLDTNGFIDIFDTTTGETTQTINLTAGARYADANLTAFDWSPDGQFFVAATLNPPMAAEIVGFWDRSGNLLKAYTRESATDAIPRIPCTRNATNPAADNLTYFEWANDSRTLLVGLTSGLAVCRLNIDGTIDSRGLRSYGTVYHWSPDQRWLAGAINTDLGIWIADTANNYQTVSEQPPGGGSAVISFTWSPDSQHLAVGTIHELWIGTLGSSK